MATTTLPDRAGHDTQRPRWSTRGLVRRAPAPASAPGPAPAPPKNTNFPCFDGLRAIAALLVVGVHATFASGFDGRSGLRNYSARLEIGVEVFFVISGFLLYRPFAVDHFGGRPVLPTRSFWVRRLKRIVPAYWVAFLFITYVLKADTVRHAWFSPLIYLGFAQIYSPHYYLTGLTQAWSLCNEMTFYLMLPLYAALVVRRRRSIEAQLRVELLGLVALTAAAFAFKIPVLAAHGPLARIMPNWLPGYLDQFALGMLLAVLSAWSTATQRRPRWLWHPAMPWVSWTLAVLAFLTVSNIGLTFEPIVTIPMGLDLARQALYGVFAFFLVAPAVFGPQERGVIRRVLRWRPLAVVGVVSYGVYLWHEAWGDEIYTWTGDRLFTVPLIEMITVMTGLAIAAAAVSYIAVERPILRWKPGIGS